MHLKTVKQWQHDHTFGTEQERPGEARTRWVVLLTVTMMVVEIVAGKLSGSMALTADGWHMGTHAAALGIALFAYIYARRHARNRNYSFGTGKVTELGGFASSITLAIVALLIGVESVSRLADPVPIKFDEAILVAVIGLVVNLVSAFLLGGGEHHHHHDHHHEEHDHHHHDHNLRGAYLHVLADALTSVTAIVALITGRQFGWLWMDPLMGVVGAVVIAVWSIGLLRDTGRVLLDADVPEDLRRAIRERIEGDADNRIADLHVWRVAPDKLVVVVSVVSHTPREPDYYKALLAEYDEIAHLTVEVNRCPGDCLV